MSAPLGPRGLGPAYGFDARICPVALRWSEQLEHELWSLAINVARQVASVDFYLKPALVPRLTRKAPRVSLLKYFWHAENARHGLQPNVAVEFFAALERPLRETAK